MAIDTSAMAVTYRETSGFHRGKPVRYVFTDSSLPLAPTALAQWSAAAAGTNVRQTDVGTVTGLADHSRVTRPGGSPFAASGFIVDCPIVAFA